MGQILRSFPKLIDTHFHNEEAMMKKANYGDFESHHNAHTDFVATLKSVTTPVNDAQLHWAKDWLVTHIKGTDFKYKGKL
ncbi:hypothetical protein HELRODRAFT_113026 [Helobdella robusta]|uniref:Hemerythrin-like domain-containing protein n=1 Tax=Helobdella robusta TaxID=6412 RepID=T1EFP7_HELRO|nr:hypothetical protein HELRODRAFT_113026 [Helobdella robusta]ESO00897.1 hypothetical protein HELRODRAFT_113026 [Helobdella robusta]